MSQTEGEVVEVVSRTPGAVGYVKVGVQLKRLLAAAITNRHDRSVAASSATLQTAAANSMTNIPPDFRMWITDAPGANSYPIASYSYMLLNERQADRAAGSALIRFLTWVLHDGQKEAAQMNYGPLPQRLVQMEQAQLRKIQLPALD